MGWHVFTPKVVCNYFVKFMEMSVCGATFSKMVQKLSFMLA